MRWSSCRGPGESLRRPAAVGLSVRCVARGASLPFDRRAEFRAIPSGVRLAEPRRRGPPVAPVRWWGIVRRPSRGRPRARARRGDTVSSSTAVALALDRAGRPPRGVGTSRARAGEPPARPRLRRIPRVFGASTARRARPDALRAETPMLVCAGGCMASSNLAVGADWRYAAFPRVHC